MREETKARIRPIVWAFAVVGAFALLGPVVFWAGLKAYSMLGPDRSETCTGVTVEEVRGERDEVLERAKTYLTTPGADFVHGESAELTGAWTSYRAGIEVKPGESFPGAQLPTTREGIQRALDELTVKQSVTWDWRSLREGERNPMRSVHASRWNEGAYYLEVTDTTCVPVAEE
jgi:hypothetical protein